jgi:hypothetical protein
MKSRLRPRNPVDALALGLEVLSLVFFVGEIIRWPPDSLDRGVILIRVATLLVGAIAYYVRRLARKEPLFDYRHWP